MRENRTHGSEGGEGREPFLDPYRGGQDYAFLWHFCLSKCHSSLTPFPPAGSKSPSASKARAGSSSSSKRAALSSKIPRTRSALFTRRDTVRGSIRSRSGSPSSRADCSSAPALPRSKICEPACSTSSVTSMMSSANLFAGRLPAGLSRHDSCPQIDTSAVDI